MTVSLERHDLVDFRELHRAGVRCQRCGDEMYSYAVSEREAKHVQRISREVLADEYCEGGQA